jgi:hypothetical protein
VADNEARYLNKQTGVHFSIEFLGYTKLSKTLGGPICFEINYFRPSFFALEADLELTALVQALDLVVNDPQMEGMGTGDYDSALFFRGWRFGNRFTHKQVIELEGHTRHFTLPTAKLVGLWRWTLERPRLQRQVGPAIYVPEMMILNVNGHAATAVGWKDGLPFWTPRADYLLVDRRALAPRFLAWTRTRLVLVPWKVVAPLLAAHGETMQDGSIRTTYDKPPKAVVDFLRRLKPTEKPRQRLHPIDVMDDEMIMGQFEAVRVVDDGPL